jgi:G3E family GTPase
MEPDFLSGDNEHEHDDAIQSVSLEAESPIDQGLFQEWIGQLLATKGNDLLRTKGILDFAGERERFVFQAVHMIADGDFVGPWRDGAARRSKLVFIGRNLNRPQLRRGFEACLAGQG